VDDPFVASMLILAAVCLVIVAVRFVRDQVRWYRNNRPNRRVPFRNVRRMEPFKDDRDWQRLFRESVKP
jgi:hypothetical protein